MSYNKIFEFKSKKNNVFLIKDNEAFFVLKEFSSKISLALEMKINYIIKDKIKTPKIIKELDNYIVYEYIKGQTLLGLLEEEKLSYDIILKLIDWLELFYKSTGLILADAHLRNFIYNTEIYGIDFETAKKGDISEDIASLVVFILTYEPMFTDYKIDLTRFFIKNAITKFKINKSALNFEIRKQFQIIQSRRKMVLIENDKLSEMLNIILH